MCEADNLDGYTAEKLIHQTKAEHGGINQRKLFTEQSKMIRQINKELGPDLFSTFIPNYRALATISQIFSDQTPVKKKVLDVLANILPIPAALFVLFLFAQEPESVPLV